MTAVGVVSHHRLTCPAAQLIQDGGSATPVGVFSRKSQQRGDLVPAPLRRRPFPVEGLGHGLTGHGERPREASGVQWCLQAGLPRLRRAGLPMVGGGQEGGNHRGEARGVQECRHRAGSRGIHLVQAMDRLIQCDPAFDLPADPIEVSHLSWADPRREIGEEAAVARRRGDPNQA